MALNPDGAGLVAGTTDGLPVRLVKPHSADKVRTVRRDLGTVGRAMSRKWSGPLPGALLWSGLPA